jgi:hypothetical protein
MQSSIKLPQSGPEFPYDFLLDGLDFDGTDAETITAYQHVVANLNLIDQRSETGQVLRVQFPKFGARGNSDARCSMLIR